MADLPEPLDGDSPWDRQAGEPQRAYAAFRIYRDLPAVGRRVDAVAEEAGLSYSRGRQLCVRWDWRARAEAWDDACHKVEDKERLEAIRSMHSVHRQAGRAALMTAVRALGLVTPEQLPIHVIPRLLELGAKLERSTLIVSVEELQGIDSVEADEEDPWERIARALSPAT